MLEDVQVRSVRTVATIFAGYLVGALLAALLVRGLAGPPASPTEDVVDLTFAFVVLAALLVGGPAGVWIAMRLERRPRPGTGAGIAAVLAIPVLVIGSVLLSLLGLDHPTKASELARAGVTCAPSLLIPLAVWFITARNS
jgi:hypothetical protein